MQSIKNKDELQKYFNSILKEIEGVSIKSILSKGGFYTKDHVYVADMPLYINLENGKTIVLEYYEIDKLQIDYIDSSLIENDNNVEVFNFDKTAENNQIFYSRLAYGAIKEIKIRSVKEKYNSWINGDIKEVEPTEETFDQIQVFMDNGIDFSLCPEDAEQDGYLDVKSEWVFQTTMNIPKHEIKFTVNDLTEKDREILKRFFDYIDPMAESEKMSTAILQMLGTIENIEQLVNYLNFKAPYYSMSDVIGYSDCLEKGRIQFLPQHMFGRWLKETNERYNKGDYYQIDTVYNCDCSRYYIWNEKGELEEQDASNFIELQESRVVYIGSQKDGLEPNKEYGVKDVNGDKILLENGKEIDFWETDPIDFIPKIPKPKKTLSYDNAVIIVQKAFDFGKTSGLYQNLSETAEFCSENAKLKGKNAICNYIEKISRTLLDRKLFSETYEATISEDVKDGTSHYKGERFIVCRYSSDNTIQAIYIETDGYYITKITVSSKTYAFKVNEYIHSKKGKIDINAAGKDTLIEIALEMLNNIKGTDDEKNKAKAIIQESDKDKLQTFILFYIRDINVGINEFIKSDEKK